VQGAGAFLPAFYLMQGNRLEPILTTADGDGKNYPSAAVISAADSWFRAMVSY